MKHIVTYLEISNEPYSFKFPILGNCAIIHTLEILLHNTFLFLKNNNLK